MRPKVIIEIIHLESSIGATSVIPVNDSQEIEITNWSEGGDINSNPEDSAW
ncbi:hypothetical protein [Sphingobacterium rhinopitheci]|uniref:hypothetical protein n=1 Tax=Sphingobacterium rhinopitheci TaxID=2781960 RepID=UPI001F526407|nr:hypothetical protein [Sphingobacterium rhinopitheci]MCI0922726.1 hypothetical protein [Sphingobacterium rhinopitheci]